MRAFVITIAATLIAIGCTPSRRFKFLPAYEVSRFERCLEMMRAHMCERDPETLVLTDCFHDKANEYAAQRTPTTRKQWLIRNGCPAYVVDPDLTAQKPGTKGTGRPIPEGVEAEMRRLVKERLQLDTGCPVDRIKVKHVVQLNPFLNAYRLKACEKPYTCESDARTTTCHPALADEESADAGLGPVPSTETSVAERRRPLRAASGDGGTTLPGSP